MFSELYINDKRYIVYCDFQSIYYFNRLYKRLTGEQRDFFDCVPEMSKGDMIIVCCFMASCCRTEYGGLPIGIEEIDKIDLSQESMTKLYECMIEVYLEDVYVETSSEQTYGKQSASKQQMDYDYCKYIHENILKSTEPFEKRRYSEFIKAIKMFEKMKKEEEKEMKKRQKQSNNNNTEERQVMKKLTDEDLERLGYKQ